MPKAPCCPRCNCAWHHHQSEQWHQQKHRDLFPCALVTTAPLMFKLCHHLRSLVQPHTSCHPFARGANATFPVNEKGELLQLEKVPEIPESLLSLCRGLVWLRHTSAQASPLHACTRAKTLFEEVALVRQLPNKDGVTAPQTHVYECLPTPATSKDIPEAQPFKGDMPRSERTIEAARPQLVIAAAHAHPTWHTLHRPMPQAQRQSHGSSHVPPERALYIPRFRLSAVRPGGQVLRQWH